MVSPAKCIDLLYKHINGKISEDKSLNWIMCVKYVFVHLPARIWVNILTERNRSIEYCFKMENRIEKYRLR